MHADGAPYGSRRVEPKRVSVNVEAFEAIKSLGFRAGDARRAVDQAVREQSLHEQNWTTHVGATEALREVMQGALQRLQPC
jgi:Holliday junction resolvasome RuvABC DNA-binding subunit